MRQNPIPQVSCVTDNCGPRPSWELPLDPMIPILNCLGGDVPAWAWWPHRSHGRGTEDGLQNMNGSMIVRKNISYHVWIHWQLMLDTSLKRNADIFQAKVALHGEPYTDMDRSRWTLGIAGFQIGPPDGWLKQKTPSTTSQVVVQRTSWPVYKGDNDMGQTCPLRRFGPFIGTSPHWGDFASIIPRFSMVWLSIARSWLVLYRKLWFCLKIGYCNIWCFMTKNMLIFMFPFRYGNNI